MERAGNPAIITAVISVLPLLVEVIEIILNNLKKNNTAHGISDIVGMFKTIELNLITDINTLSIKLMNILPNRIKNIFNAKTLHYIGENKKLVEDVFGNIKRTIKLMTFDNIKEIYELIKRFFDSEIEDDEKKQTLYKMNSYMAEICINRINSDSYKDDNIKSSTNMINNDKKAFGKKRKKKHTKKFNKNTNIMIKKILETRAKARYRK